MEENTSTTGSEDEGTYISLKAEFEDFAERDVCVICRFQQPTKPQVQRCQKEVGKNPDRAFRTLILDCVHKDDKDRLIREMDTYPGLPTTFGSEILRRSGFDSLGK